MILQERLQQLEQDRLQLIQQRDNLNAQILRFEGAILLQRRTGLWRERTRRKRISSLAS